MIAGIRSYTETAAGRQGWSVTWPATHGYSTGTATITLEGRCPNCGEYHFHGSNSIYVEPEPEPDLRATIRQLKRDLSHRAITRARIALQRALDDPGVQVPIQDRKRPYVRPRAKKRVCSGSSRYRVMVN
jgi:hypothetical protein